MGLQWDNIPCAVFTTPTDQGGGKRRDRERKLSACPSAGSPLARHIDPITNTGVVPLQRCGPNGATLGPQDNLLRDITTVGRAFVVP